MLQNGRKQGNLPRTCRAGQARRKKPPGKNLRIPILMGSMEFIFTMGQLSFFTIVNCEINTFYEKFRIFLHLINISVINMKMLY